MGESTGASFYDTTDALGSVTLLTESTQTAASTYSYDSWGKTTATGVPEASNPWGSRDRQPKKLLEPEVPGLR